MKYRYAHISTTIPITIVNESIAKCKYEDTPLFIASIDAEKAFDRVWRTGLFFKLKEKVNKRIWLILFNYYKSAVGVVKYKNIVCGPLFNILSGVKQGGVLSPFLFNMYIEDLIIEIKNLNLGVNFFDVIIPLLGFCDDILLMSMILADLQKFLNICTQFSTCWNYNFNAKKSMVLNCAKDHVDNKEIELYLNKEKLKIVDEIKYLGMFINNKLSYDESIKNKFKSVQASFFSLFSFGLKPNGLPPNQQALLFKTYCLSKATYALGCIKLNNSTIKNIKMIQNNLIRFSLG
jgi:hypothetical protein